MNLPWFPQRQHVALPSVTELPKHNEIVIEERMLPEPRCITRPHKSTRFKAVLTTLAITTLAFTLLGIHQWSRRHIIDQCGTTAAEARSRGCIFETAGFCWVPPACHDASVDAEFVANADVQFWRDVNRTEEVSMSEVQLGNSDGFYITHQFHRAHCAYLLKKLHRAVDAGRKLDGLIGSVHHTSHCVTMLLNPPEDVWTAVQFAYTKWPYCGRNGGYNVHFSQMGEWTDD